ncbi:hypothetical protein [Micromonospora sp. WMMB235]|uniref:hypothetical protein n=1 Tax=Micromonospora sp. WMMB235 TaxID=1172030 RepID=UPI001C408FEE|nr:hypothetical protein [Micromonospora sp. WMMB235]
MIGRIRHRPLAVVVLAPRPEVVAARERDRSKKGYGDWPVADPTPGSAPTPRIRLWLDTSGQTPEETVTEILARAWTDGQIG